MPMFCGKITEFDKSNEDWVSYVERVTLFFETNGIEGKRKKGYLLSSVGVQTYKLLRMFISTKQTGR